MNYTNVEVEKAFLMFGVDPMQKSENEIFELQRNFGKNIQESKPEKQSSSFSTGTVSYNVSKDSNNAQLERYIK